MNLFTEQKQAHRHRKQIYGCQRGKEGGINQEVGIKIYILLYIKQIINMDLLFNTGNYTQYLVITYKGNNLKRIYIYVYVYIYIYIYQYMYTYITESLCCTPETKITL